MYDLIEYSSNYSVWIGLLWFDSKDEVTSFSADIVNNDKFKFLKCWANIIENTVKDGANGTLRNSKNVVPLKYLSNFLRSLQMSLISCKK